MPCAHKRFTTLAWYLYALLTSDDILDWVAGFTGDAEFVTAIDEFVEAHAKKFEDMEEGEYTLECVGMCASRGAAPP